MGQPKYRTSHELLQHRDRIMIAVIETGGGEDGDGVRGHLFGHFACEVLTAADKIAAALNAQLRAGTLELCEGYDPADPPQVKVITQGYACGGERMVDGMTEGGFTEKACFAEQPDNDA